MRSREGGGGNTSDYHPIVLMNRTNDTAPFNPSNNHLYCYPLVLSTLRCSVGVMHSNTGTLGEIVCRTCTHRAFYEKERSLGVGGYEKIHIKSGFSSSDTLIQFSRCAYAGKCMWQI